MKWNKKTIDPTDVRSLSSKLDVNLLAASVFTRRGVTELKDILYYLVEDLSFLHSPYLFADMEKAVSRIYQAVDEGEKVKIFGDRDVDGIASTVMMKEVLAFLGTEAGWSLPQGDDPYGLNDNAIEHFASEGGSLLITVDCGISDYSEIAKANSLGIDTIVVDHHNPADKLPDAFAIINPKVEDCGYPFRDLAGCGVAAKVVWALLFAKTRFYNRPVCLLNVVPGNESYILDAAIMVNLVEVKRIREVFVPNMPRFDFSRLIPFFENKEIFVYDGPLQMRMLKEIFGEKAEIAVSDLAPEVGKIFPHAKGRSLLRIGEGKDGIAFRSESELDVLSGLFRHFVVHAESLLSDQYRRYLDLVAMGTLADLMPLRNENRLFVKFGLEELSATRRQGLRELILKQNLHGKKLTTIDVGWQLSPLLNAAGRLGVPERAAQLLFSEDREEQRNLVDEILGLNRQRKKLGEDGWNSVFAKAQASFDESEGKLILVGSSEIHRGITGIVASRLVKFFNSSAMVVAFVDDRAIGSARSIKGFNIRSFLDGCSDLLIDYGGHDNAAGYSMHLNRFEEFQHRVKGLVAGLGDMEVPEEAIEIDAELPHQYMTPELLDLVDMFEPYGEANPPLVFMVKEALIKNLEVIGKSAKSHAKMLIDTGKFSWPAVFWNAAERINRDFSDNERVDIIFRLGRNYFQNRETPQLTILDIRR